MRRRQLGACPAAAFLKQAGGPPLRRAVDEGGNGSISPTELFQLFQRLEHPIRWGLLLMATASR